MGSIWSQTCSIGRRPPLRGHLKTQAAVVGAGMAGVLTAYALQQAGLSVVVLEADRIAGGQTQNTTAKITSQHGLIYSRLIQSFGEETARRYAKANQDAVRAYQDLIDACRPRSPGRSLSPSPTMGRSALKGRHSSTP